MSDTIDLSLVPPPDIVATLDQTAIRDLMLADLVSRDPLYTAIVSSDPAYKIIEAHSYRETLNRGEINDAARAVMLAEASGADLDGLAANVNLIRLTIDAGDAAAIPPVPPTYETDAALKQRILLSWESLSVAGPVGAYKFHIFTSDGTVKDASVKMTTPGTVDISVLSTAGNGVADAALIATVDAALNDDVRPLTDNVVVQSASIISYAIAATIKYYDGPSAAQVLASAQTSAQAYADAQHSIGRDITQSGLLGALHVAGVQDVALTSPVTLPIVITDQEAAYSTGITLTDGGVAQ